MPQEVFDSRKREWVEMTDAEFATYRVVASRRYSEVTIDRAALRARAEQERRMDDSEIEDAVMAERIEILEQMWENIGKPPQEAEKRMVNYLRMLARIPNGLLRAAVDRAMFDNGKFLTVPTPGAIVDALRKELGNPYDLSQAITRWEEGLWYRAALLNSEGKALVVDAEPVFYFDAAEVYA